MTFTTREAFAGGFRFAALASSARERTAKFVGGLDESLVAAEVLATGLLGATFRLVTLRAPANFPHGRFDEAFATLKLLTRGLSRAALFLRTLGLSTGGSGSFDETAATLQAGAGCLSGAALLL